MTFYFKLFIMINSKIIKTFFVTVMGFCMLFSGCKKLQDGYEYNPSYYNTELKMSVMDFMQSRRDIFSGMLAAIEYVDTDPNFKDVKEMYSTTGNTFLLFHNNALINLEDATSYWSVNTVTGPDPNNPTVTITMKGSDWSQYPRDTIARLLRYHVLKGTQTYSTLNATPRWVETFGLSTTNDSAKVYLYLENVREANLRINNYVGLQTTYKGVNMGWVNLAPRTPDLHATNGIVHVLNKWLIQPTREAIRTN
jgi:hypothetical protein